jgi:hypothetical protein
MRPRRSVIKGFYSVSSILISILICHDGMALGSPQSWYNSDLIEIEALNQ